MSKKVKVKSKSKNFKKHAHHWYEADDIVGFTSHFLTFPASTTSSIPLASQYADSSFFLLA